MFGFGLVTKLIIIGVIATTVIGLFTAYSVSMYNKGWYAHEALIHEQDRLALEKADTARARFRACVESNGVWDVTSGECLGR